MTQAFVLSLVRIINNYPCHLILETKVELICRCSELAPDENGDRLGILASVFDLASFLQWCLNGDMYVLLELAQQTLETMGTRILDITLAA